MRILGSTYALLALLACQASASDAPQAPAAPGSATQAPQPIIARDAAGAVTATIRTTRPCAFEIGATAGTIAATPIYLKLGDDPWSTMLDGGSTYVMDGRDRAARVQEQAGGLSVFDPQGAAWIRVDAHGDIHGAGGQLLRSVRAAGDVLHVGDATVTGTRDPLLAAVLTSPELPAPVRALVACNRLLSNEATPL